MSRAGVRPRVACLAPGAFPSGRGARVTRRGPRNVRTKRGASSVTDQIEIGDIAKATVTGFEGTVISRTERLNRSVRLPLHPQGIHEDKPIAPEPLGIVPPLLLNPAIPPQFSPPT